MKKRVFEILYEWLKFTLYWVLIMAVLFPLAYLFVGLWSQLFPGYVSAGKAFFTIESIFDYSGKGALVGFLWGSMIYVFTRVL